MYKITITKLEPNPNYVQDKKEWNSRNESIRYNGPITEPPDEEKETRVLSTTLTDEEFDSVRKACLGIV
ncbi:MAG: hypothetical protein WC551_02745 [Patescibacteria group bacterium]